MDTKNITNYLGITFLCVLIFVAGFYFGFQYSEGRVESNDFVATESDIKGAAETIVDTKVITKELVGAYWIKAGEEPVCPSDHPIKGKVDGSTGFFYTKANKYYDTVKPVVCFATEDYASNEAGFIKKY